MIINKFKIATDKAELREKSVELNKLKAEFIDIKNAQLLMQFYIFGFI